MWILLILITFAIFALMIRSIILFQTSSQFQNIRQGTIRSFAIYSLTFTIIYLSFDQMMHYLLDLYVNKNWLTQKYQGQQLRKKRSGTMVKYIIGTSYYLMTSVLGYIIIKNSTAWPTWLGGSGKCVDLFIRVPYQPDASQLAQIFMCISFSKHFSRLLLHIFVKLQGDFYSMTLHHLLSIFLIFFSYSLNFWMIGIFIIVIHDASDFFNSFVKIYLDFKLQFKWITYPMLAFFPIIWFGTRNVIFPLCFIFPVYEAYNTGLENLSEIASNIFRYPSYFAVGMLSILQIFHIVVAWTITRYYIAKIKEMTSSKIKKK